MNSRRISKQSHSNTKGRWTAIILGQVFLFILLNLLFLVYFMFGIEAESLVYPASIFLAVSLVWSIWSWKTLVDGLFDPYILFLTAAVLFNGGHALLEVFQLNEDGIMGISLLSTSGFAPDTVLKTLLLVLLGLLSFHFGGLVSIATGKRGRSNKTDQGVRRPTAQHLRWVGWALLLISFIPVLIQLGGAITVVMSSGYFGLYQRQIATGFGATSRVLATFLIPGAFFLLAGSKERKRGIIVSGVVICGYSVLQFFLGARSTAAMPLIAYAWLWHRIIGPLPKGALLAAGMAMLVVVFPLVHAIRNISGNERLGLSFLVDSFFSIDNPAVGTISEMGESMRTVAYTMELVPGSRPFDMGLGYGYALLTVMPNLFWDIHPTIAHGLAANWLVWTVAPGYAALGGGFGFSFIAEAYLNFGWIGSALVLGLIGFLFGRFVLWAQRSGEPAKLATAASFLAFFLLFARGESGSIIRPLAWYTLLPYILVLVLSRLKGTRPRRAREHIAVTGV